MTEDEGCGERLWYRVTASPSITVAIPDIPGISVRYPSYSGHISPYDALTASTDMKAALTIPMHYGTFDLSDEPLHDPPQVFTAEAKKRRIDVYIPVLGEIVKLKRM